MYVCAYVCVCLCVCIMSQKGNRRLKFYPFRLNRLTAREIHTYVHMHVCVCLCLIDFLVIDYGLFSLKAHSLLCFAYVVPN